MYIPTFLKNKVARIFVLNPNNDCHKIHGFKKINFRCACLTCCVVARIFNSLKIVPKDVSTHRITLRWVTQSRKEALTTEAVTLFANLLLFKGVRASVFMAAESPLFVQFRVRTPSNFSKLKLVFLLFDRQQNNLIHRLYQGRDIGWQKHCTYLAVVRNQFFAVRVCRAVIEQ